MEEEDCQKCAAMEYELQKLKGMNKGGWNEEKYVEEPSNLYKGETGELFCFKKCVSAAQVAKI
jgi:hypothetical protein